MRDSRPSAFAGDLRRLSSRVVLRMPFCSAAVGHFLIPGRVLVHGIRGGVSSHVGLADQVVPRVRHAAVSGAVPERTVDRSELTIKRQSPSTHCRMRPSFFPLQLKSTLIRHVKRKLTT